LIVVNGYYPPVGKKYNSIVYITSEKKKWEKVYQQISEVLQSLTKQKSNVSEQLDIKILHFVFFILLCSHNHTITHPLLTFSEVWISNKNNFVFVLLISSNSTDSCEYSWWQ
jgi:hypothetical protein